MVSQTLTVRNSLTPERLSTYTHVIVLNLCCHCHFSEALTSKLFSKRQKNFLQGMDLFPDQSERKISNSVIGLVDFLQFELPAKGN